MLKTERIHCCRTSCHIHNLTVYNFYCGRYKYSMFKVNQIISGCGHVISAILYKIKTNIMQNKLTALSNQRGREELKLWLKHSQPSHVFLRIQWSIQILCWQSGGHYRTYPKCQLWLHWVIPQMHASCFMRNWAEKEMNTTQ